MTFTPDQLDALERPARRKRVTIGSAKDDTGASEADIQAAIVLAIRRLGIGCGYNLHGEVLKRASYDERLRLAARLKRLGAEWGTLDLSLRLPVSRGGPAYGELEVKRPGQALTTDELRRTRRLEAAGHKWGAVCSVDEAIEAVRAWGWL